MQRKQVSGEHSGDAAGGKKEGTPKRPLQYWTSGCHKQPDHVR
jgi:hypothetical protein